MTPSDIPVQDAFILAELLGHARTTIATLTQALAAYQTVRLPLANHVLRGSKESGDMYEINGPLEDDLATLGPQIGSQWAWLWETTPEGEREKAFGLLLKSLTPLAKL